MNGMMMGGDVEKRRVLLGGRMQGGGNLIQMSSAEMPRSVMNV